MGTKGRSVIANASLRELYDYWHVRRGTNGLAPRCAIDPLEMPRAVLPQVMITEVMPGEDRPRYRYRLVGTGMVEAAGFDPTWRFLDEVLPGSYGTYVLELYDEMIRARRPLYSESDYVALGAPQSTERTTQRLMLPMADEDGEVRSVLSGQTFDRPQPLHARPILKDGPYRERLRVFVED